jgi:hypothetical protein
MTATINVFILCNSQPELKETKQIQLLNQFIPRPPSCDINVITSCTSDFTSDITEQIAAVDADLIVNYGLELGLFFNELETTYIINNKQIAIITDNHSINSLFYTDKFMYSNLFDIIKKKIEDIDLVKSRPSKLFVAKTEADLIYLRDRCFKEPFGADTETSFLNAFIKSPAPKLLCYSLAWLSDEEEAWCIPTSDALIASGNCTFTKETVLKYTEQIFFESEQAQFWHNFAYDGLVLHELFNGRKPKNFMADTMVLLTLYHHANKSAALKENTHLIGLPAYKDPIKDWIKEQATIFSKKKKETKGKAAKEALGDRTYGFEDVPLDILAPYASMDALAVVRLVNFLKKNMDRTLWSFYYKIPHKVIITSNELACEGYTISRDRFLQAKLEYEKQIKATYADSITLIDSYIDDKDTFNIASGKQLGNILFNKDKLNLPVFNKTKKKSPSTNQKALDDLILFHPFIFKLSKLKKLLKLYSTYSYRGYSGVLNEGSRSYKRIGHWTINAQYSQTNRTARLGSTNFSGHNGEKHKGGPILTLPSHGSMVKQYFCPNNVAEQENILYDKIVAKLSDADKLKISQALTFDISLTIKPSKSKKKTKEVGVNEDSDEDDSDS